MPTRVPKATVRNYATSTLVSWTLALKKVIKATFCPPPPSTKISSVVTVVHKKIALKGGASRYPWKAFRNLPRGRGVHNQLLYTFLCIGGTGLLVAEGA